MKHGTEMNVEQDLTQQLNSDLLLLLLLLYVKSWQKRFVDDLQLVSASHLRPNEREEDPWTLTVEERDEQTKLQKTELKIEVKTEHRIVERSQ